METTTIVIIVIVIILFLAAGGAAFFYTRQPTQSGISPQAPTDYTDYELPPQQQPVQTTQSVYYPVPVTQPVYVPVDTDYDYDYNYDYDRRRRRPRPDQRDRCRPTGCSGQICSDRNQVTTCEHRCEYDCFKQANCTRRGGRCQWDLTPAYRRCVNNCNRRTPRPTPEDRPRPRPRTVRFMPMSDQEM